MTTRTKCGMLLILPMAILLCAIVMISPQAAETCWAKEAPATPPQETVESDEADKVIDFASVRQENLKGNKVALTIKNDGDYTITDWSVVFNADFKVKSIKGARLVSEENAVQFKHLKANAVLDPGESVTVTLKVGKGSKEIERFRVYAICPELPEESIVNDVISYDCETGEERLMCSDEEEYLLPEDESEYTDLPNVNETNEEADVYGIIPPYDSRVRVWNVNAVPYRSIGRFIGSFSNSFQCSGTAFMIGNRHALTSAHCIWNKKTRRMINWCNVRFGESGTSAKRIINVRSWRMSSAYRANPQAVNDWACLIMQYGVNRGYFKVGYASKAQLLQRTFTVAGYPADKRLRGGYAMYKMSGRLRSVSAYQLTYYMDTASGQSGAPVYNSNNGVYGVHSGVYSLRINNKWVPQYNRACYLNPSRVNYFKRMRWCGIR